MAGTRRPAAVEDPSHLPAVLERLGLPPDQVVVLTLLSEADELSTDQLLRRSGLSQPQLSRATSALEDERSLLRSRSEPLGRGRPPDRWRLSRPLAQLIERWEQRVRDRLAAVEVELAGLEAWRTAHRTGGPLDVHGE